MKHIKYIFLLVLWLPAWSFSCENSFLKPRQFVATFFSDPFHIEQYKGQAGYLRFVEEYLNSLRMDKVFQYTSQALSEEMHLLGWQTYRGGTKSFIEERSRILDESEQIRQKYMGLSGYIRYADRFYDGNMQNAYMNISAVLSKEEMNVLGWQQYQGNTKSFIEERSRILDGNQKIKGRYKGLSGYAGYADRFYGGDMQKTYQNVSAVLSGENEMPLLNWQQYQGDTKSFIEERSRILDRNQRIKGRYKGLSGYAGYADRFYGGSMQKTYMNISAVLSKEEMNVLGWQIYQGNTKSFIEERSRILDRNQRIKGRYKGLSGYAGYADRFYDGDMQKTYKNVSAVLSREEMKLLGWQAYRGYTESFREERLRVVDENEKIRREYNGLSGYIRYADRFYGGNMQKTYQNVSAVLSGEDMKNLGWKYFIGNTWQINLLIEFFKNHNFEEYKGKIGQRKIAKLIFRNHLTNTYRNVSVLREYLFRNKNEFKELRRSGWAVKPFP